ncbi:MAG: ZIP family metal transporter [Cyclobacteriaceae bacterium]|nr:ZIP family metal transporter [Cyclobacteriaceae bacterium]
MQIDLKYFLVFAGAFIFSITIVHLLPELLTASAHPQRIGMFVLLGFFMQIFLDFITSGVEHGHLHKHEHHVGFSPLMLMVGLCIHAFMDGSILVHPGQHAAGAHSGGLLIGIVLHKIPAAIALMSVLLIGFKNKKALVALLLVFSLASPAGLIFSEFMNSSQMISQEGFLIIFAIVSGNFLHISTTIYFESSPDHTFHKKKIFISLIGAMLAILTEFLQH